MMLTACPRWRLVRPFCTGKDMMNMEQGSAEWHAVRRDRITASAFGSALGMWRDGRANLWREKVSAATVPGEANAAMAWGSLHEADGVARYEAATGQQVDRSLGFCVYKAGDPLLDWLGASPDGLLQDSGILEVKCPHQKPPWSAVPFYYMPQAQGLLEILDRPWLHLWVYTPAHGSALFSIERDRRYWQLIFRLLSELWWQNIVPARLALASSLPHSQFAPSATHPLTPSVIAASKELARQAPLINRVPSLPPAESVLST